MKTRFLLLVMVVIYTANIDGQIKINSTGNVGIGLDNPLQKLHVNGSIRGDQSAGLVNFQTDYGYLRLGPSNSSFAHFYTDINHFYFNKGINVRDGQYTSYDATNLQLCTSSSFTPRLTIQYSNGYVGILMTNPSYALDVNGYVRATNVSVGSDERLKTNISDLSMEATERILNLQAKTYQLISPSPIAININQKSDSIAVDPIRETSDKPMIGFIAQDLVKYFPELVHEDNSGYLSIDYMGLIPVLVEAIKKQQIKIDDLEKKIASISNVSNVSDESDSK